MGGSAAWRPSPPTASRVRSNGASTGSPTRICLPAIRGACCRTGVKRPSRDSDEFYAVTPADDCGARRATCSPSRARSRRRIRRTTRSARATSPIASPRGRKRAVLVMAAVEFRRRRARRAVPAAQSLRHLRAAPEPSVSRRADAARAHARRLHRQRQRRPDGAGVPPGGARRAARHRLAARAGLRVDRHPRHQPRLVPGDADDGARAARSRRRR